MQGLTTLDDWLREEDIYEQVCVRAAARLVVQVSTLLDPTRHPAWPAIEAMLAPADDSGTVFDPSSDVLWIAHENGVVWGAATTRLMTDGTAELLCVAGSRFREWIGPMDGLIEQWARDCGASKLETCGRVGWGRFAERHGWARTGTDENGKWTFEKRL